MSNFLLLSRHYPRLYTFIQYYGDILICIQLFVSEKSIVCKWEIIRCTVQIWKLFLEACIKISGLCCNNDFKRVFGRPIWVWRVNKSRVGALSHLSDRTGTIAGVHTVHRVRHIGTGSWRKIRQSSIVSSLHPSARCKDQISWCWF